MDNNPLYHSKKPKVMGWLADHQLVIGEFKEKAFGIFAAAGFPDDAIEVKTQTKKAGILKDIIQESYQNYSALVVGRTGVSRLKDMVLGSMAHKLAEKIKHIPTVIVAGKPTSRKILVALDESIEAMRGVSCIGALASAGDLEISLCHCLKPPVMTRFAPKGSDKADAEKDWRDYHVNRFKPYMDEATQRLVDAGVNAERISRDFIFTRANPIQETIDTAVSDNFGTIVTGRRGTVSFTREHLRGRFSEIVIKSLDNMAVWVVG
jgi:nucleotide-binding universal stress UspA family protein